MCFTFCTAMSVRFQIALTNTLFKSLFNVGRTDQRRENAAASETSFSW